MAGDFHGTEIRQIFIVIEGEKSFGLRLTLDVYFYKIQKFLREGRGKTGYKRVTKRGRRDFGFWVGKVLRALGETESGGQSVGNCEGENTRPRVFRAAPTLPGGWKQGSVLRWDLTSSHPAVPAGFRRGRRKRHAMARALPSNAARAAFSHHFQIHPDALGDLQKSRDRCLVLSKISIEGWHMEPSFFLLPLNVSK